MVTEKHYPTDPLGAVDAGAHPLVPKPCLQRIRHDNELEGGLHMATWCTLREGHAGQCSGPPPRVFEPNSFMPGKK